MSSLPRPYPPQDSNTAIETSSGRRKGASTDLTTSEITQDVGSSPRPSGSIMKRTMEKFSLGAQNSRLSKSEIQRPSQTRKRLFSLTKRGKDEQSIRYGSSDRKADSLDLATHNVSDSPFIRPPSPEDTSTQPDQLMLGDFGGTGSMHPGTQTLIQAIQALPWTEEEEPEDANNSDGSSDTDEESISSEHAIHQSTSEQTPIKVSEIVEQQHHSSTVGSVYDDSARADTEGLSKDGMSRSDHELSRDIMTHKKNYANVLSQHRIELATKLREAFEMDDISEVVAEIPCWMLRSILLQGFLYLTNAYLCFFARIPSQEEQVLKSGSLQRKAHRTKRLSKYWFILKNDALSWYNSSSDPYFPRGMVDLRYIASCDISGEKGLELRTRDRVISLLADSTSNRDEWMKAIQKVIFKAQNMGECVKIAIPYSLIIDVDKSSTMGFNELLELKVIDKGIVYSVDSYYFTYFRDLSLVLEQIRSMVRQFQQLSPNPNNLEIKDSTVARSGAPSNWDPIPSPDKLTSDRPSSFRLVSLFKTLSAFNNTVSDSEFRDPTSTSALPSSYDRSIPCAGPSSHLKPGNNSTANEPPAGSELLDAQDTSLLSSSHTYPPPPSPGYVSSGELQGLWGISVPSWLRIPGRRVLSGINLLNMSASADSVKEIYTAGPLAIAEDNANMEFSVIETNEGMDPEVISKFHSSFALNEKENLLGVIPGYLFRALPVWGKFYISSSYLCFRSSKSLTKTRMIIPIQDILNSESAKGYRFGMHGLVVIIKGHEELFFEFSSVVRRDLCTKLLKQQLDQIHLGQTKVESRGFINDTRTENFFSEGWELQNPLNRSATVFTMQSQSDSLPAVMFTSSSSTFLTFKPSKPLHFTLLTIGSRGDVQPYIALGKRLLQEGHRVRIATHGEFQPWIESHSIEFAYVGGDPAELMRLCVENGVFTVSFLKESTAKFRAWIDDLLKTSWEACQGTDVLIESPSAMGGIHIAEALKIPYFRAFTMPWSRTRAYPHAFAVPERKMGGGYNYMTYVLFDQVFWRGISGQINRWRRKTLELSATNLDKMEQHKIPFLYNFSPFIVPPPLDWYEWVRVTGYWFLDDADVSANKWTPSTDLIQFIERTRALGKKLVYIGFGSIVVSDPEGMTRCVVEAIEKSNVHVVLSKGWSDRLSYKKPRVEEPKEEFPDVIFPIASIPHDWLFSQIDAACHHGGAGTTGASLRAGIPTIIKPFFGDQFFWGDRVEALGVGTSIRKLTVESLTAALVRATTDTKQISRAGLVGQTIRAEDGVGKAVEAIYRDLEYARSLIKRDSGPVQAHEDSRPPSPGLDIQRSPGSIRPSSEDWTEISEISIETGLANCPRQRS